MRFTVTGSLGNIGLPLTQLLVAAGHEVTVVSHDSGKKGNIKALGARAAIGSIEDTDFLTGAFEGADGVYTMIPPNWGVNRYRDYIGEVGEHYMKAIWGSGVKKVVNLSSIGANLSMGTGPVAGLHDVEEELNALDGVAIRHLRAGYFFTNFFFDIDTIRAMGVIGANYGGETKLVMVHPKDIVAVAAEELECSITGKSHLYVVSEEGKASQYAGMLGKAVDKPGLSWVQFSDEDAMKGMIAGGMSKAIAESYIELGRAIGSGLLFEDFEKHRPRILGVTKFADFIPEFVAVYRSVK